MTSTYFKRKAKQNGKNMEAKAAEYFKGLKLIFNIIDAELNGVPTEIKSCQEFITDRSRKNAKRYGRFRLHEYQHNELLKQNGVYLFIVHNRQRIKRMAIIPAKDVKFRQTLDWRTIFKN